ncbi:hypothetical protein RI367_006772 [Sorochytrium milnesiophthora]
MSPSLPPPPSHAAPEARKHVLLLSGPYFGHVTPSIELAVQLVRLHQCRVTMVLSDAAARLVLQRGMLPAEFAESLTVAPLRDGVHDFDEVIDETDLLASKMETAVSKFDAVARVLRARQGSTAADASDLQVCPLPVRPVDHIVVESLMAGAMPFLRDLGIPMTGFWPTSAWVTKHTLRMANIYKAHPDAMRAHVLPSGKPVGDGLPRMYTTTVDEFSKCAFNLINTFDALEPNALSELQAAPEMASTKLLTVGPLALFRQGAAKAQDEQSMPPAEAYAKRWLDVQTDSGRPVVYISHGSAGLLSPEQVCQFVDAIEQLSDEFAVLWSMRPAQQTSLPAHYEIFNGAPERFVPKRRTVLVMGWAPQCAILAHTATRAFVSHCGWNSTIEAIGAGKPVLAWPLCADAYWNADMLADLQMAVKVPDTTSHNGRTVPAAEIVSSVRKLLHTAAGTPAVYERNAQRISKLAAASVAPKVGSSVCNLNVLWCGP